MVCSTSAARPHSALRDPLQVLDSACNEALPVVPKLDVAGSIPMWFEFFKSLRSWLWGEQRKPAVQTLGRTAPENSVSFHRVIRQWVGQKGEIPKHIESNPIP